MVSALARSTWSDEKENQAEQTHRITNNARLVMGTCFRTRSARRAPTTPRLMHTARRRQAKEEGKQASLLSSKTTPATEPPHKTHHTPLYHMLICSHACLPWCCCRWKTWWPRCRGEARVLILLADDACAWWRGGCSGAA